MHADSRSAGSRPGVGRMEIARLKFETQSSEKMIGGVRVVMLGTIFN